MPTLSIPFGVLFSPTSIDTHFDIWLSESSVQSTSATQAIFTFGTTTYTVSGTGLTFGVESGQTILTGGTMMGLGVNFRPGYDIFMTDLQLSGADLATAAIDELADPSSNAFEDLLYTQSWEMNGNSSSSSFLPGAQSYDGNIIALSGGNLVNLFFGADRFAAGSGNDTIFGGDSDDTIWGDNGADLLDGGRDEDYLDGGGGRDRIYGAQNDDTILGGNARDHLFGEHGDDLIRGGNGRDVLVGGWGDDDLFGGAAKDIFIFRTGRSDGDDIIHDFETAEDHVIIRTGDPVTFSADPDGLLLSYGADSVLFMGLALGDETDISLSIIPL